MLPRWLRLRRLLQNLGARRFLALDFDLGPRSQRIQLPPKTGRTRLIFLLLFLTENQTLGFGTGFSAAETNSSSGYSDAVVEQQPNQDVRFDCL